MCVCVCVLVYRVYNIYLYTQSVTILAQAGSTQTPLDTTSLFLAPMARAKATKPTIKKRPSRCGTSPIAIIHKLRAELGQAKAEVAEAKAEAREAKAEAALAQTTATAIAQEQVRVERQQIRGCVEEAVSQALQAEFKLRESEPYES
jgi:hypothetical protein